MGQHHAVQPIDRDRWQAQGFQRLVQHPTSPIQANQAQDRHDHRQQERRAHQQDQRPAPKKAAARQGAGHGQGQQAGQQRRQRRLRQRKAQSGPVGGAQRHTLGLHGQRQCRSQHQRRNAACQRPSAYCERTVCHSSTAGLRAASASTEVSSSDFAGVIRVSNPTGRPAAGVLAGYIQLVVGITAWAASPAK